MSKEPRLSEPRELSSPYPIDIGELVRRFERLYTSAVIDIFQSMGLHNQWLGPDIKCLTRELRREAIAGYAFTVQWIADPEPDERDRPAAHMVAGYPRDSIIVVDAGGDQKSGFWGELATTTCIRHGVRGAVIAGGAKDTGFIRELGFPLFARFSSPVDGFHHSRLRGWQLPIWMGDVLVRPWDMILADADGVLVIPQDLALQVLEQAEARRENEDRTRDLLRGGIEPDVASQLTGRTDL